MEPRNVYNYVINLAHLKHSAQIYGKKKRNALTMRKMINSCLQFQSPECQARVRLFSICLRKENILYCSLSVMLKCCFHLYQCDFFVQGFFFVSMPSASITEPLRVIYKQLFPLLQHVPSYLCSREQICVVMVTHSISWPDLVQLRALICSFTIHKGHKLKLPDVPEPCCSCRTLLKTSLHLSCFPDVIKC